MLAMKHLETIKFCYSNASIQIPNSIFKDITYSQTDKPAVGNIQNSSFAYTYLVVNAFLYKYGAFVDLANQTYIQNKDLKILLGYSEKSKKIDKIIKEGGVLDELSMTTTIRDFPASMIKVNYTEMEIFTKMFSDIDESDELKDDYRQIIKNRNYKVKQPHFLIGDDQSYGTLLNYEYTVKITVDELIFFLKSDTLNNKDFMIYSFIKSLCSQTYNRGYKISFRRIHDEINISNGALRDSIEKLKELKLIHVSHGSWSKITSDMNQKDISSKCVPNTYFIRRFSP